jgi:hypothetical protein
MLVASTAMLEAPLCPDASAAAVPPPTGTVITVPPTLVVQ